MVRKAEAHTKEKARKEKVARNEEEEDKQEIGFVKEMPKQGKGKGKGRLKGLSLQRAQEASKS